MNLWEYIKENMLKHPGQVVCENKAEMTYEELVVFAQEFAKRLSGINCCAILCKSEMAQAMALLSCFAAKVTAVPLSQRYGEIHCNKILDFIRPDAIVTDLNGGLQILYLSDSQYICKEENPALIMCTSGTTGTPKGAMLSEKNIITNVSDIAKYFKINSNDYILISRPLYHCAVLTGEFLTSLIKGVKIRFYSGKFNPHEMIKMLHQYNITVFCGTPTLLDMMARFKKENTVHNLKHICISGECMGIEVGHRIANAFPKVEFYHIYGLTEASPRISYLPPNLFHEHADCVGIPLDSVSLKIVKEDGTVANTNEIGVLWVKGENVMVGYYNAPEKTAKIMSNSWLCTGDLALINETGLLKIKGRNDNLIIKAGMNIYPQELENALKQDSRVYEVRVYSKQDIKSGTQIIMDIAGEFSSPDEVKELCKKYLSPYQMPAKINLLNELEKSASGKIIRR